MDASASSTSTPIPVNYDASKATPPTFDAHMDGNDTSGFIVYFKNPDVKSRKDFVVEVIVPEDDHSIVGAKEMASVANEILKKLEIGEYGDATEQDGYKPKDYRQVMITKQDYDYFMSIRGDGSEVRFANSIVLTCVIIIIIVMSSGSSTNAGRSS